MGEPLYQQIRIKLSLVLLNIKINIKAKKNMEDVIIIGAGISGLTAAHNLQKSNLKVLVLESGDRVGGRMTSDIVDGFVIDRGAQFLSDSYSTLIPLIKEVGLGSELKETSQYSAIVKKGIPVRINNSFPYTVLTKKLLPFKDLFKIFKSNIKFRKSVKNLSTGNYSEWNELDDENAFEWCDKNFGNDFTEYILEPALEGFYFQSPEKNSKAIAMMLMAFNSKDKGKTLTLKGGLGTLPEKLAKILNVKLNVEVEKIIENDEYLEIETIKGNYQSKYVILSVPATSARKIFFPKDKSEEELMSVEYSSTLNIGIASSENWNNNKELKDVYGVLIPRKERANISAIAVESRKHFERVPHGELLDVMLCGDSGKKFITKSESEIMKIITPEIEKYFWGISQNIIFNHIIRWKDAEPYSPVGRSKNIYKYRKTSVENKRVFLAGDYMGMPFTDGAAETGIWASEQVIRKFRKNY